MTKTVFLSRYKLMYEYHPDEPISENKLRKNASEGTFNKIIKLMKRSK